MFSQTLDAAIAALEAERAEHAKALGAVWREGAEAQREADAKIAEFLSKGQVLEIGGEKLMLGSIQMKPGEAQKVTAESIAAAILSTPLVTETEKP